MWYLGAMKIAKASEFSVKKFGIPWYKPLLFMFQTWQYTIHIDTGCFIISQFKVINGTLYGMGTILVTLNEDSETFKEVLRDTALSSLTSAKVVGNA